MLSEKHLAFCTLVKGTVTQFPPLLLLASFRRKKIKICYYFVTKGFFTEFWERLNTQMGKGTWFRLHRNWQFKHLKHEFDVKM